MTYHINTQDVHMLILKTQAVIIVFLFPVFQFDDKIDLLALLDTLNTKKTLNIDDTDTTQFDQMLGDLRGTSQKSVGVSLSDLDHVICHQTMSSADQLQCSLALSDTAFSCDQKSFTIDIDQYTMNGRARCQKYIEFKDQLGHELGCPALGSQDRDLALMCNIHQRLLRYETTAKDHTRYVVGKQFAVDLRTFLCGLIIHICMLYHTDHLDPVCLEVLIKSIQL